LRGRFKNSAKAAVALVAAAWGLSPALTAAQQPSFQLPPAARPDVPLEPVRPVPEQPPPPIVVPEAAPTRAPAGAERIRFTLQQVEIEGATVLAPETLRLLYADRLDREISLEEVYVIADSVQRAYRAEGYFLARAIVPAQEITDGRVRLVVVEGYISDVQVEGDVGPIADKIAAYLQDVVQRRPLKLDVLERALLLANDLPGVRVVGVLRPSPDLPGAAQLVATAERKRFEGLALVDNYGSSFTGKWQGFGSVSANSFTSQGEQVTLSGLISNPPENTSRNQKVGQFSASFRPGSSGWYARTLISYCDSRPTQDLREFDFESDTLLIRIAGGYPIIRSRNRNLTAEAGFDFIDSNTDIFTDQTFSRDRLRVLYTSLTADMRDAWRGASTASLELRQGIPVFNASRSGDGFLSRVDGTGLFTKIGGSVSRLQALIGDFAVFGVVAGQYAFNPLLADEEFNLGGARFGRGYDPGELSGDQGIGFSGELQYTRYPGLEYMNRFQLFGFYEVGKVWQRDAGEGESLASAGGGVRLWPTPWLFLELLAAKPLTLDTQRADGGRDPQILFRMFGQF
jgi:hemolysin activation/secretion protein